jgi:tRNA-Thr(GGU) m(6)t(6)A37 methyltransferase TsaA
VDDGQYVLRPIGRVESTLVDPATAPRQGVEGSPVARLDIDGAVGEGLRDLQVGAEVIVLTWLHRARRDVLAVHPRDDRTIPEHGVFSTRSPDRPNPIGLHRVRISAISGSTIEVHDLEAVDGTPVLDLEPALHPQDR